MAFADSRIEPARRKLARLDKALSDAQTASGEAIVGAPATDKLASEVWSTLEAYRKRIRKMIERAERSGGVL